MMKKILPIVSLIVLCAVLFAACSGPSDYGPEGWKGILPSNIKSDGNYNYEEVTENDFVQTETNNESYFSLDRNTASYGYMRRQINEGLTIAKNSVRLEEYVNYFNYNYDRPTDGNALAIGGSVFDCPWNAKHKLFKIGVAAEEVNMEGAKTNNLVFLIDTSGSMYGSDRLGLIQQAFTMLTENLGAADYISIVTYAGDSRIALDGARGNEKTKIANVLQDLTAEGSTNGQGGLEKAYAIAQKYFDSSFNNRVIIATDGDFNVGVSDKNSLTELISQKRSSGIYLSVLGVGMYNTSDTTMKTLAENGNGNYAYLDSVSEARKVLVEELGGTINTVAKDCKIGVTFNKDVVESFRLIGYETKLMNREEFENENKDAGEIGSGHTVTAVYEVALKGEAVQGEVATAKINYKDPSTDQSKSVSKTFTLEEHYAATPSEDDVFVGCVVEFGLLLRESEYKADASFASVIARLDKLNCVATDQFKAEFLTLVSKAARVYEK